MSIQKEDVYESEDVPLTESVDYEEQFDDPCIEKIHMDMEGAIKLFGNRILNADDVDFSDESRRRRGYRSGHYVLQIDEPAVPEAETIDQKFRRLRMEIEELSALVETEKNENVVPIVNKNALNQLNDLLKAALLKKDASSEAHKTQNSMNLTSDHLGKSAQPPKDFNELKGLDERIKRIEEAVLGQKSYSRPHYEPLAETIENLRIQVESLNPTYLEGVSTNLSSAINKLNEFDEKRNKVHNDELEQKVSKLYQLVTEWDVTCANVPSIVKRLHTLSKLHEQDNSLEEFLAQEFSSKLSDLSGVKEHIDKKVENHKVMLLGLKGECTKMNAEFEKKIEQLERRIENVFK